LSWRGLYQADRQPGARQLTTRCPLPRGCASRAGSHWQGIQLTSTRPGPHG